MTSPVTLSGTDRVLALEEIKRVFAARLHALDMKQWDLYPTLHTDDVVSETWGGVPVDRQPTSDGVANRVVGNERLGQTIRAFMERKGITSVHHGHTPLIDFTSDTTARGTWAMEDMLWWTHPDGAEERLHGYGHYHEEYRLVEGVWLISYRSLSRIRVDHTPRFHDAIPEL
ncbi:nuclear transport factor 2 family protein [Microbacter sp. ANSKLAB05]|nr:nuclear transport factor 2 family protein [Microbacter sp. ANSKLAB05]